MGGSAHGADIESLKNISKELVDIRHQIENLHNKINDEKELYKDQFRSYSNQKSDLDVKISRADLNIKDLERELARLTEINKEQNRDYDEIVNATASPQHQLIFHKSPQLIRSLIGGNHIGVQAVLNIGQRF